MIDDANEDPADRARKYIASFEKALQMSTIANNDTAVKSESITEVSDAIQRYLSDARHYLDHDKPTTALAAIAYAEGLLDALTFLGLVESKTVEE